jgi:imidazolonepropionase-like amidohydrolase
MKRIAGMALIALLGVVQLFPQQTTSLAITGAKIIDGTGGAPIPDGIVIIEAGRITRVGTKGTVMIPAGARVLDAAGKFLIPGLIDTHVHLEEIGLSDVGELPAEWDSPERLRELVLINARLDLIGGITTVRDLGSTELVLRVRDEINAGRAIGPRIIASGMQLVKKVPGATEERMFLEFDGPADGRAKVRSLASMRVDLIKIRLTRQRLVPSLDEVQAIVSEAHRLGLRATVHTDVPADDLVRLAIEAGADGIEHNAPLRLKDDALLAEMAQKGITLMAGSGEFYVQRFEDGSLGDPIGTAAARLFPADVVSALRHGAETLQEQTAGMKRSGWDPGQVRTRFIGETERARKAGILLVFGTDAGAYLAIHGEEYKALYGETRMGSTPMEALLMATRDAAKALGKEKDVGTIEAGKLADLVIVDANPLTDMRNLHKIFRVIKDGVVYSPLDLLNLFLTHKDGAFLHEGGDGRERDHESIKTEGL